ncbi:MAG: NADH-quinone oxidoreductase subunit N [Anaerolineae bacterium]
MLYIPTLEQLNLMAALPVIAVATWACVLVLVDLMLPKSRKGLIPWLVVGNLVFALVATLLTYNDNGSAFLGMYRADAFTGFLNIVILLTAILSVMMSISYVQRTGIIRSEYYILLMFSVLGMMLMASSTDLVMIFVALELLSIPLYVMSAFRAPDPKSEEAGIKYFLLGAFASAFFVFGAALVYGATGATQLDQIFASAERVLQSNSSHLFYLVAGAGLMLVGLGFKVAIAPFHVWTPDVYEGAPTSVAAFMSVGAKLGGFAALLRIATVAMGGILISDAEIRQAWQGLLSLLAAFTVFLGNLIAIAQYNVKRMLAYSSIANAGYILIGLAAGATPGLQDAAVRAVLVYLVTYLFTTLGAFAVVILMEKDDGSPVMLDDFIGLGRSRPLLAFMMAVFMLSLIGVPLTAGFIGKVAVFGVAVNAGLIGLVVFAVLMTVVSAYYYARIIVNMYLKDGEGQPVPEEGPALRWAIYICFVGTLAVGILPTLVTALSDQVVLATTLFP